MREHPDFQLGSAEFPMPEIMIGGYAPLAGPALYCLWMEAPEDGGSSYAIEKRFNSLRWSSGCGTRRIESIEMHWLSSGTEPLWDAQVNWCI